MGKIDFPISSVGFGTMIVVSRTRITKTVRLEAFVLIPLKEEGNDA
jgi:hypothetical protein